MNNIRSNYLICNLKLPWILQKENKEKYFSELKKSWAWGRIYVYVKQIFKSIFQLRMVKSKYFNRHYLLIFLKKYFFFCFELQNSMLMKNLIYVSETEIFQQWILNEFQNLNIAPTNRPMALKTLFLLWRFGWFFKISQPNSYSIFQDKNLPSVTPLGGVIEEEVTSKAKFDFPKSKTTSPYITTFILELLTFSDRE